MHWIIQKNLYAEDGIDALLAALQRFGISSTTVSMGPSGTLTPDPNPSGPVMVCGSVGLARVARERGWQPGSFLNADHNYQALVAHWGREMLNADARISAFRDVEPNGERVFIRPAEDSKYFNGGVMDAEEVMAWRDALVRGERSPVRCSSRMSGDTQVVCGPPATIYKECRFFVVDGAVVAWSTYKQGGNVVATEDVDPVSLDHAQACVQAWQPARAFVLDTALTPDGPRIVEVNCINSAGFYGADVQRIVMAIEGMEPWASRSNGE
jgi:hypothetical protein